MVTSSISLPDARDAKSRLDGERQDRWQIGREGFRHVLGERWSARPLVGWAGMNPSDASDTRTDPTWLAWRRFGERWGAGGQIVVNPHPGRSPNPDVAIAALRDLACGRNPDLAAAMEHNLACIRAVADEPVAWIIGWGDKGGAMNDIYRCHAKTIAALREGGARRFLAFGLTASGNPKHVLARGKSRLPDDAPLYDFDPATRRLGVRVDPASLFEASPPSEELGATGTDRGRDEIP